MLTICLMIGSFVFGAYCSAAYERQEKLPAADWVFLVFLSCAWPLLITALIVHLVKKP
jgi:hypothetical protein